MVCLLPSELPLHLKRLKDAKETEILAEVTYDFPNRKEALKQPSCTILPLQSGSTMWLNSVVHTTELYA